MPIKRWGTLAIVSLAVVILSGCHQHVSRGQRSPDTSPLAEPLTPAGYVKVAPDTALTSHDILTQTAAIIEGDLTDVKFTYDNCAGPRTNYVLTGIRTLAGSDVGAQVTLSYLGGPLPNGSWIKVSELPRLALNSHYIAFVRKTDWTFSPIVGGIILRREAIGGREVLVAPEGQLVTGWEKEGIILSDVVTGPVGHSIRGYKKRDTPPNSSQPPVGDANPNAQFRRAEFGTPAPSQQQGPPIIGTELSQAPTAVEIRAAGFFDRPAVLNPNLASNGISSEALISSVKKFAEHDNLSIGGRVTLYPYWRCWSFTPTARPFRGVRSSTVNASKEHL